MKKRVVEADLHNHSTASDGEFTPSELVDLAHEIGLGTIGLTDHDTVSGIDEALSAGRGKGITVVPGIEVTLRFKRSFFTGSLHLLLYFPEKLLAGKAFKSDLEETVGLGRGMSLVKDRVEAINRQFGPEGRETVLRRPLTVEEISSYAENISRRHFFLALSEKHDIQDKRTIDRLIGNNSPAYIPSGIDIGDLLPLLREYQVVKVLSHPAAGSFPGESHYREVLPPVEIVERLLPEFLDKETVGIDGLEVYYPAHTEELEALLLGWAERYNLLVTGGSDCHDGNVRPLGVSGMTRGELEILMDRLK